MCNIWQHEQCFEAEKDEYVSDFLPIFFSDFAQIPF